VVLNVSKVSEMIRPMIECYIPENLNPQQHYFEKLKSHTTFKLMWVL